MKKLFHYLLVTIVICFIPYSISAQYKYITADGSAPFIDNKENSLQKAREQAIQKALTNAIKLHVNSPDFSKHHSKLKNQILDNPEKFINSKKIIFEECSQTKCKSTMQIQVDMQKIQSIVKDIVELKTTQSRLYFPTHSILRIQISM